MRALSGGWEVEQGEGRLVRTRKREESGVNDARKRVNENVEMRSTISDGFGVEWGQKVVEV